MGESRQIYLYCKNLLLLRKQSLALASPSGGRQWSLGDNHVWDLVELPPGRKVVGSKWVYKRKTGAEGSAECYKARIVAQGYTQKYGTDYDETFCLVVRQESLRVLLGAAWTETTSG